MSKIDPNGQDTATLLGLLSGAMPNPGWRKVECEVASLHNLTEFFNAVVRSEDAAYETYFPNDVLERARPWVQQACFKLGKTGPLTPEGIRHYLRFACVPQVVYRLACLFDRQITKGEIKQYTQEEMNARAELCLALMGYTGAHSPLFQ